MKCFNLMIAENNYYYNNKFITIINLSNLQTMKTIKQKRVYFIKSDKLKQMKIVDVFFPTV